MNRSLKKLPLALTVLSGLALAAPQMPESKPDPGTRPGGSATGDTSMKPGTKVPAATTGEREKFKADQEFVTDAANLGNAEVELSRLALKRASNEEVKKFAQTMIDDHEKVNDELKSVVSNKQDLTVPASGLEGDAQKKHDKLSELSGDKFDREYVNIMIDDHKKAVRLFERYSKRGEVSELKDFAAKHLPHLKAHLDQAQGIERDLKGRM